MLVLGRHGPTLWSVTSERVELVASMTAAAPNPDVALEELARYASTDAKRE